MYQTFKPSLAVLIMSLPFLLFPSASHAQVPLTLPETVHLALAANDPGVKALEMKAQAFEDKAIADSQLPDPVLSTQIANFPLASLDYNREAMTQLKFGISQKLPKGQTLILTRNKRQTEARSYRAQKALIERQIVLQARQTWLELYYWREAKRLTLESRKQVSELGGVANSVFASGRSSLQDVLRVELETTALDAKLLDIERKRDMARATLERLLGPVNGARPLATKPPLLPVLPDQSRRVRPIMMTVAVVIAGLLPIMLGSGTGSEVMRRIAAPMVGGMTSATILTLLVIPAAFLIWKTIVLRLPEEGRIKTTNQTEQT